MPSLEQHCRESVEAFGKRYEEVHRWLDEYAGAPGIGMRHRAKRHHAEGIEECVRRFGEEVREVARQHIISDLRSEGWTDDYPFPKNERHYRAMGLF
jgi:hypothetical protein